MKIIENLLEPINVLHRAGKDLTYSVDFDDIKRLRSFDDPTLDQGEWVTDLKVANWPEVVKRCTKLLQESSKDLRLVIWMTEALVHTKGFAGLAEGYFLFAKLSERYWDSLYPEAEEGDQEQRVGSLSWLLAQSVQWVTMINVVDDGQNKYSLGDFAAARSRSGGSRLGEASPVTQDQLDRARSATPQVFYQQLWESVRTAMVGLGELQASMEKLMAAQAPGFSAATDALQSAFDTIQRFAKEVGVSMQVDVGLTALPAVSIPVHDVPTIAASIGLSCGDITSRTEALAMLRKVAEYFRQAEPHSPAAYLADQAAKWGGMTLHEWLPLVLRDDGALARLEELLGVTSTSRS
jgi:type VI secretion system protein ImpA